MLGQKSTGVRGEIRIYSKQQNINENALCNFRFSQAYKAECPFLCVEHGKLTDALCIYQCTCECVWGALLCQIGTLNGTKSSLEFMYVWELCVTMYKRLRFNMYFIHV